MLAVINRAERTRSIVIVKHKYMLMCNHKIRINKMRCLRNSTVRREIGQYRNGMVMMRSQHREDNIQTERYL